jgi:hypothetical protein
VSDPGYVAKGGIPEPEFDASDVGTVNARFLSQLLLRESSHAAKLTEADGEISNDSVLETQAS